MLVEVSVVLARSQSSIFLLDKEEWGGLWRSRLPDFARFEMLVNESLACFHFLWVHGIGLGYFWSKSLF